MLICSLGGLISMAAYLAAILVVYAFVGFFLAKPSLTFWQNLLYTLGFIIPNMLFWTNPLWLADTEFTFLIWGPSPLVGWLFGVFFKSYFRQWKPLLAATFLALYLSLTAICSLQLLRWWEDWIGMVVG